jgi:hypothetical protein
MYKIFKLNDFCQCRIWFENIPDIKFTYKETVTNTYPAFYNLKFLPFKVVAEINIFKGPRSLYGALGFEFIPKPGDSLTVELPITDELVVYHKDTLLTKPDIPYIGLPLEYSIAVQTGIEQAIKEKPLIPSGRFCLRYTVHGAAYSNSSIFKALAYWVTTTWGQKEKIFDEEILKNLLVI